MIRPRISSPELDIVIFFSLAALGNRLAFFYYTTSSPDAMLCSPGETFLFILRMSRYYPYSEKSVHS